LIFISCKGEGISTSVWCPFWSFCLVIKSQTGVNLYINCLGFAERKNVTVTSVDDSNVLSFNLKLQSTPLLALQHR
jgi:hypothetical protein